MSDDPKCVAGCVSFYGGEKRHHKDCPYYPESLTKAYVDRIEELEAKLAKALRVFEEMRNDKVGFRHVSHFRRRAAVVIAELTGGKDE